MLINFGVFKLLLVHSCAGSRVAMLFSKDSFFRTDGGNNSSDGRLQYGLQGTASLWHQKHIHSVCVILFSARRGKQKLEVWNFSHMITGYK